MITYVYKSKKVGLFSVILKVRLRRVKALLETWCMCSGGSQIYGCILVSALLKGDAFEFQSIPEACSSLLWLLGGVRNVVVIVGSSVMRGAETSGHCSVPLGIPGSLLLIF